MDEIKVNLTTKFMRNIVAKLMMRAIRKKYGYEVNIQLNDIGIEFVDGETKLSANVEAKLDSKEFVKIVKEFGLD